MTLAAHAGSGRRTRSARSGGPFRAGGTRPRQPTARGGHQSILTRTSPKAATQIPEPPIARFLFADARVAWFWAIVRVYVGWQWLVAGVEKLTGHNIDLGHLGDKPAASWVFTADTGAAIKGFALGALAKAGGGHPAVQGWYADFLRRAFVVEVMGRASGYLALMSAIATGAELAIVPERALHPEVVAEDVQRQYARGKLHYIIVVAGGAPRGARDLTEYLCQHPCGFEARLSVLGHVQRGGGRGARRGQGRRRGGWRGQTRRDPARRRDGPLLQSYGRSARPGRRPRALMVVEAPR